eukprot:101085_1
MQHILVSNQLNIFFSVNGQSYFIIIWTMHFIACTEAARLWLVSYDLHYIHSSRNNEWKSIINDSLSEKHFYLKYRMTFGNNSYVIRALLIYYLFVVIVLTTLRALYPHSSIYNLFDFLFYFIVLVFVIYLYWKCRKYKDHFLFHFELKVTAIMWLSGILFYIIGSLIIFVIFPGKNDALAILNVFINCMFTVAPSLL